MAIDGLCTEREIAASMSEELTALKSELAELAASFKSPNQLAFAKELAIGKSQEQAYVDAGYKSKKPAVDAGKAIERCPSIARYKILFQKIAQLELLPKQIGTFEQKRQMLWDMAVVAHKSVLVRAPEGEGEDELDADAFNHNAVKAAQSCIAELNKMDGDLAAIKTDNKHTHEHEELTDEQLAQRIADLQRKVGAASAS